MTNQQPGLVAPTNERASRSRRTNDRLTRETSTQNARKSVIHWAQTCRSLSPLNQAAKDHGICSRITNPYSENEESDKEDEDYNVVVHSATEDSYGLEEDDTIVPEVVQHVRRTGYPSDKGVKKSLDINEARKMKETEISGTKPKTH